MIPYPKKISIDESAFYEKDLNRIEKKLDQTLPSESYTLQIGKTGIEIRASSDAGFFYGQKTLEQLKFLYNNKLPLLSIEDEPKYSYRGFMLDVSRHFFDKDYVKKIIKIIASFKMNKLHLHLTDDQGWRIEIDKYPLLTKIGSKRAGTRGNKIPHSGFYSKADIAEILSCAEENFVEIIPEIDFPGHFASAIAAYPNLGCTDEKINVRECFGISPYIACGGRENSLTFMKDVLSEVAALFPSEYIHLGADEASKAHWLNCKECQAKLKELNLSNEDELQNHLINELTAYLNGLGKKVICWNDGFFGGNILGDVIVEHWKEDRSTKSVTVSELIKGRTCIAAPFFKYYLDYPYGMTSLKKTYEYLPEKDFEGYNNLIWGVESPLWTEYVPDTKKADYMAFPRAFAVAETGWSDKKEDFLNFTNRLRSLYPYILSLGVQCAPLKETAPNFLKGKIEVIKFFLNSINKETMEYGRIYLKAKKAVEKKRNGKSL